MRRLLISAAITLACITATAAAEDDANAAQGVGDLTETGTNPSGADPITGKPPSRADAGRIKAAERSADAAALAAARRGESHAVVDAVADAAYIAALNHGAKAGAKAGGMAGTIRSQP